MVVGSPAQFAATLALQYSEYYAERHVETYRLRDKLARSIYVALRKRPVEAERVERVINSLVRQLESSGDTEIPSEDVGELVMEALSTLDKVAYIRFASVYRNFREAKDFGEFVGRIAADDD